MKVQPDSSARGGARDATTADGDGPGTSQVHFMAEFQEILDFPPAPKLDVYGKLDPKKATPAELRGQAVFFG